MRSGHSDALDVDRNIISGHVGDVSLEFVCARLASLLERYRRAQGRLDGETPFVVDVGGDECLTKPVGFGTNFRWNV